jgi:hypothetical protein
LADVVALDDVAREPAGGVPERDVAAPDNVARVRAAWDVAAPDGVAPDRAVPDRAVPDIDVPDIPVPDIEAAFGARLRSLRFGREPRAVARFTGRPEPERARVRERSNLPERVAADVVYRGVRVIHAAAARLPGADRRDD